MSADRAALQAALERGESDGGAVEFKERLTREVHLQAGRFESLAAQLRHRVLSGDGRAEYVLGVTDAGGLAGIAAAAFEETVDVLRLLADEAGAEVQSVQTWAVETTDPAGVVGIAEVVEAPGVHRDESHIVIGTAGHVDHGKSTLVGSLVTGAPDDGQGATRRFLDVQPHEVERGLSADLSYAVYGHGAEGPIHLRNPHRKDERAEVVRAAERVVSFVDTVGHEPWLRTTIRGLVGQRLDYGLLVVAADDGPTRTTREHLGILLAMELPTVVAITKTDMVDDAQVDDVVEAVEGLLRQVGRTPLEVARYGVDAAVTEIDETVVPIVATSAISMAGLDVLDELFRRLPKRQGATEAPFRMYIDRTYAVTGVGAVASGTITAGEVTAGDALMLGPMPDGRYRPVEVRSIEQHYHRVDTATAGRIVGIALKGVKAPALERGMVLCPAGTAPPAVRAFEAEVMVLNHPTRIQTGYEPVVHLETISEAAEFSPLGGQLLPGDTGTTEVRFKFRPYYVEAGQRFVFREGQSKGVGTVTRITETAPNA